MSAPVRLRTQPIVDKSFDSRLDVLERLGQTGPGGTNLQERPRGGLANSWLTCFVESITDYTDPNMDIPWDVFGQVGSDVALTSPTGFTIGTSGLWSLSLQWCMRPTTDFDGVFEFGIITPGPSGGDPYGPLTDYYDCITEQPCVPTGHTNRYRDFRTLPTCHYTAGDEISWYVNTTAYAGSVVMVGHQTMFAASFIGPS